jgi:hypothetical protein
MIDQKPFYRALAAGMSVAPRRILGLSPIRCGQVPTEIDRTGNLPYKRGGENLRLALQTLTATPKTAMLECQRRLWERACVAPIWLAAPVFLRVVRRLEPGVGSARGLSLRDKRRHTYWGTVLGRTATRRHPSLARECHCVVKDRRTPPSRVLISPAQR